MQAERDHLRNFVFPRLEEELHKRHHHLEWVDLRQGVDSGVVADEEQRELIVLKICLAEIKRSRPFLIVILGDRYGWIPSNERMEAAICEAGFQTRTEGKSVTALEIEFGIFKESPDQQNRCFFYLREPLRYENIPEKLRADYSEEFAKDDRAAARRKALEEFKTRLTTDDRTKSRVRTYKADWDTKKNTVIGLEALGETVFQDLWKELKAETAAFTPAPAPTWEESERAALAEFVELRSRDFTGREESVQTLLTFARSPITDDPAWAACVSGPPGSGKSALFAKLHKELESDFNVLLLSNAAGATIRGSNVDVMLRRWIADLAQFLDVKNPLTDKATIENVDLAFASLLGNASAKKRVVVILDALNQFEQTPRAKHLTWLPNPWPANARLVTTAQPGPEAKNLMQMQGVCKIELLPLTTDNAHDIAKKIWKHWHVPWNDDVWRSLAEKQLPDGTAATGNPLWTTLATEQLALLDADDFTRAEQQFATERDPQARLGKLRQEIAGKMPPDVSGLYDWLLTRAENIHGAEQVCAFLCAITLSRHGWRESDLQVLIPRLNEIFENSARVDSRPLWKALMHAPHTSAQQYTPSYSLNVKPIAEVAVIRRTFRSSLILRNELQWDFFHSEARTSARRHLQLSPKMETTVHKAIAVFLLEQRSDDPVRCDEITFHLLESGEYACLQWCYGCNYQSFFVTTRPATQDRELAAATATLVDEVNHNGMQRLTHISNSDVTLQAVGLDGFPVGELDEKFEFFKKDIRRDVAKGWCRRCLEDLLPALASAAPVSARRALVTLMLSRLLDAARDFPHDVGLKTTIANVRFMAADFAVAQGDWSQAEQLTNDALRDLEGLT